MSQHRAESLLAFIFGTSGGCMRFIHIPFNVEYGDKLIQSAVTAFFCGVMGVLGKRAIAYMIPIVMPRIKRGWSTVIIKLKCNEKEDDETGKAA